MKLDSIMFIYLYLHNLVYEIIQLLNSHLVLTHFVICQII